jgi:hypothetical protein
MAGTKYFLVTGDRGFLEDPRLEKFEASLPAGSQLVAKSAKGYLGTIERLTTIDSPWKLPPRDIAIYEAPCLQGCDLEAFLARDSCIEEIPNQLRIAFMMELHSAHAEQKMPGIMYSGTIPQILEKFSQLEGDYGLAGLEVPNHKGEYEYLFGFCTKRCI